MERLHLEVNSEVIAYLTVKNDGSAYDIYEGIYDSSKQATEKLGHKEGTLKLISVSNEEELTKAFIEEINSSEPDDLDKILKVISKRLPKIKNTKLLELYNKYSK